MGRRSTTSSEPSAGRSAAVSAKYLPRKNAIAKEYLGRAGAYMETFELNKDQLSDPDKIKPGQVLRLPPRTVHGENGSASD
jgi:hypothetical protein